MGQVRADQSEACQKAKPMKKKNVRFGGDMPLNSRVLQVEQ